MVTTTQQLIFENKYLKMYMLDDQTMWFKWTGFVPIDEFRKYAATIIEEVGKRRVRRVIADASEMGVLSAEHQQHTTEKWVPQFVQRGGRRIATLMAQDVFAKMGVEKVFQQIELNKDEIPETKLFGDFEEARAWVMQ